MSENTPDTPSPVDGSGPPDTAPAVPAADDESRNDDATVAWHGARRGSLPRIPPWIWIVTGVLIISSAFVTGLWSAPASETETNAEARRDNRNGEPQVAFVAETPTAVATLVALLPTPTPTLAGDTASQTGASPSDLSATADPGNASATQQIQSTEVSSASDAIAQASLAPFVLPTVTPTPTPPPIPPRALQVGGQANLRMNIGNSEFQSGGRPVQIPIEARTYRLDNETQTVSDQRCIQMGIVNLELKLDLTINPGNTSVNARGQADLYNDFCYNRGGLIDSSAINLIIPADARVQSTHNMFGERQLLNLSGLLDMDTGVILELEIANLRPRPE